MAVDLLSKNSVRKQAYTVNKTKSLKNQSNFYWQLQVFYHSLPIFTYYDTVPTGLPVRSI